MSLFSVFNMSDRFAEVIKRFPVVIIFAVLTTISLLFMDTYEDNFLRWSLIGYIGFLVMLDWAIFKEVYQLSSHKYWVGVGILSILLFVYYYFIPASFQEEISCFWYFTIGLNVVLHFMCAVIPFFKNYTQKAFVNYNIQVFLSWIKSAFYALVTYLALCLALVAMDQLFDINIPSIHYLRLFIVMTGIFQVAFFLSDFPDEYYHLKFSASPIFRVFTSYIAIPVTLIYGLILLAYIVRIFLGYEMVEWVFVLCIWYFVIGILTWLFSLYFENQDDNPWMVWFRKWFFILSVPILLLLLIALFRHISDKGILEEFYISASIASFVLLIILLKCLPVKSDLRAFPLFLILITVITFWSGPISICNLPITNQKHRLINMMSEAGMIKDGNLVSDSIRIKADDEPDFSRMVYFLSSRGALDFVKTMDKNHLLNENDLANSLMQRVNGSQGMESEKILSFYKSKHPALDINDYQQMLHIHQTGEVGLSESYGLRDRNILVIRVDKKLVYEGDIAKILWDQSQKDAENLDFELENDDYLFKVVVNSASGSFSNSSARLDDFTGFILVKKK